jgi:hypothetical protein
MSGHQADETSSHEDSCVLCVSTGPQQDISGCIQDTMLAQCTVPAPNTTKPAPSSLECATLGLYTQHPMHCGYTVAFKLICKFAFTALWYSVALHQLRCVFQLQLSPQ